MKLRRRIIVCVTNDLVTDQRVHKVCTFLHENDFKVLLIGRKKRNSIAMDGRAYATKRLMLLFEKGIGFYLEYHIRLFLFLLFSRCSHILSNDLDTLLPAFLAKKIKINCTLIYDSHEYFTEVPELIAHPTKKKIWESVERFVFPKLKHVYTVNSSIALKYSKKYKVKVDVVRNLAPKWNPKSIKSKAELGIPENKKLLIVQGAGINVDRGIEELVMAMQHTKNIFLMVVGDGDVLPLLKASVKELGLKDKIGFYPKCPYQEMMQYTFHADLGLTLDKNTNLNYLFSLPNKVFDYIQANTPILATNLVEVAKIVTKNNVGTIISSHQPRLLANDIIAAISNEKQIEIWKQNCSIAAEKYAWEKETEILKQIYDAN